MRSLRTRSPDSSSSNLEPLAVGSATVFWGSSSSSTLPKPPAALGQERLLCFPVLGPTSHPLLNTHRSGGSIFRTWSVPPDFSRRKWNRGRVCVEAVAEESDLHRSSDFPAVQTALFCCIMLGYFGTADRYSRQHHGTSPLLSSESLAHIATCRTHMRIFLLFLFSVLLFCELLGILACFLTNLAFQLPSSNILRSQPLISRLETHNCLAQSLPHKTLSVSRRVASTCSKVTDFASRESLGNNGLEKSTSPFTLVGSSQFVSFSCPSLPWKCVSRRHVSLGRNRPSDGFVAQIGSWPARTSGCPAACETINTYPNANSQFMVVFTAPLNDITAFSFAV